MIIRKLFKIKFLHFTKNDEKSHAVFDEIALLEECMRNATIRANTNCILYEIKKDDFLPLFENNCALGSKILLNLARLSVPGCENLMKIQ
jgi:hypothetical protein